MSLLTLSPSLNGSASYETKFLVPVTLAPELLAWARRHLAPDAHAHPATGAYPVTTLYLDTPARDVLHRRGSHARRKYRVRRYGDETVLHLERKLKRDSRVRKMRWLCPDGAWAGHPAFARRLAAAALEPAALVRYQRAAFFTDSFRLTLDREIHIAEPAGLAVDLPADALPLRPDLAILEVKHTGALPPAIRALVNSYHLIPGSFSKYRTGLHTLTGTLTAA